MQIFKDPQTGEIYEFEDDVQRDPDGGFVTVKGAALLNVPKRLVATVRPLPPPRTVVEAVAEKKAALALLRYQKEVGGLVLPNGLAIATDDRSKTLIVGAVLAARAETEIVTDFKTAKGWVRADAAAIEEIAAAVASHVRACFSAEQGHSDAIDLLADEPGVKVAAIDDYDITTGWPPAPRSNA